MAVRIRNILVNIVLPLCYSEGISGDAYNDGQIWLLVVDARRLP